MITADEQQKLHEKSNGTVLLLQINHCHFMGKINTRLTYLWSAQHLPTKAECSVS